MEQPTNHLLLMPEYRFEYLIQYANITNRKTVSVQFFKEVLEALIEERKAYRELELQFAELEEAYSERESTLWS